MQLTKAWDFAALGESILLEGKPIGEAAAKIIVKDLLDFVEQSCALTSATAGSIATILIESGRSAIMSEIDKIDGVQGN